MVVGSVKCSPQEETPEAAASRTPTKLHAQRAAQAAGRDPSGRARPTSGVTEKALMQPPLGETLAAAAVPMTINRGHCLMARQMV